MQLTTDRMSALNENNNKVEIAWTMGGHDHVVEDLRTFLAK